MCIYILGHSDSPHLQNSPPLVGLSRQLQIYPRYLRKGFRVNPFESQFPFQLNINDTNNTNQVNKSNSRNENI